MSVKKAQSIVNEVQTRMGITLVAYQRNELEWLIKQLEAFLDLEIETDELSDPEDLEFEDELNSAAAGEYADEDGNEF